jgi:hypothetical protein
MKFNHLTKIVVLLTASIFFSAASAMAFAYGTDITIYDKNGTGTGWYGDGEDEEVEPDMATGQDWDLEAFFLDDNILTMLGGFNFVSGNGGILSGDIFIDIDGDALFGDIHGTTTGNQIIQDTYGYDYVFDLDFTNFSYKLIELDGNSKTQTSYYSQNQGSNPWRYYDGGKEIASNTFGYQTGLTDAQTGFAGGLHNVVTGIDLTPLGLKPSTEFIAHFTQGCGNDNLMGKGQTPVPEPATMMLMGIGLISLAGISRKRLIKKTNKIGIR